MESSRRLAQEDRHTVMPRLRRYQTLLFHERSPELRLFADALRPFQTPRRVRHLIEYPRRAKGHRCPLHCNRLIRDLPIQQHHGDHQEKRKQQRNERQQEPLILREPIPQPRSQKSQPAQKADHRHHKESLPVRPRLPLPVPGQQRLPLFFTDELLFHPRGHLALQPVPVCHTITPTIGL